MEFPATRANKSANASRVGFSKSRSMLSTKITIRLWAARIALSVFALAGICAALNVSSRCGLANSSARKPNVKLSLAKELTTCLATADFPGARGSRYEHNLPVLKSGENRLGHALTRKLETRMPKLRANSSKDKLAVILGCFEGSALPCAQ